MMHRDTCETKDSKNIMETEVGIICYAPKLTKRLDFRFINRDEVAKG